MSDNTPLDIAAGFVASDGSRTPQALLRASGEIVTLAGPAFATELQDALRRLGHPDAVVVDMTEAELLAMMPAPAATRQLSVKAVFGVNLVRDPRDPSRTTHVALVPHHESDNSDCYLEIVEKP